MTRFRVLVTDEVDPRGVELLQAEPALDVNEQPTRPWQQLRGEIGEYDAFVGRSATRLPADRRTLIEGDGQDADILE